MNFRNKILLLTSLTLLLFAVVTLLCITKMTRSSFSDYLSEREKQEARWLILQIEDWYAENGGWHGLEMIFNSRGRIMMYSQSHRGRMMGGSLSRIIITDTDGLILYDNHPSDSFNVQRSAGLEIRSGAQTIGYLHFGSMTGQQLSENARLFLQNIMFSVIFSTVLFLTTFLLIFLIVTKKMFTPLSVLSLGAQKIEQGHYDVSVPVSGNDEISSAAAAFNKMARSLKEHADWRDRLLNDISHELRTPLTLIRGELEMMIEGIQKPAADKLKSIFKETDILLDLAEEIRFVNDQPAHGNFEQIDLKDLLRDVCKRFEVKKIQDRFTFRIEGDSASVNGDRMELIRLFSNLTENSIRYIPKDGSGKIETHIIKNKKGTTILFTDNGSGIPQEFSEKIFERFFRVDTSRNRQNGGRGLGLSICREIVIRHHGAIKVVQHNETGTCFRIDFP